MATIHQLWQHIRTGEVYAVEVDGATVLAACGPLDSTEQRSNYLPGMPYERELGAAINAEQACYVLAFSPAPQRTALHWGWKELQRWLERNRPDIGLATVGGVRGFYHRVEGPTTSFVPCGFTWRDVAVRLGASRSR